MNNSITKTVTSKGYKQKGPKSTENRTKKHMTNRQDQPHTRNIEQRVNTNLVALSYKLIWVVI